MVAPKRCSNWRITSAAIDAPPEIAMRRLLTS
jgi:hypothetical protein